MWSHHMVEPAPVSFCYMNATKSWVYWILYKDISGYARYCGRTSALKDIYCSESLLKNDVPLLKDNKRVPY